jgi:hypothetical protein
MLFAFLLTAIASYYAYQTFGLAIALLIGFFVLMGAGTFAKALAR